MTQIDRLIRRIGAVLRGEAEGFEARALASDYAALMETTRERLQQCANLIRVGNENTALQVAESHPPVLDMAAKLAFADSAKWRAWCKDAGLPAPAPLEDRLVDQVNNLYSKEIDQSHPLYKEYRAAMREHDDLRALAVLRSITRVNSRDANAREEYDRLAAKVRRELLGKLREAFAHRRNDEAFAIMSRLETSGLGPFDDNADWRDASRARDEWEKKRMQGEALRNIPELVKLMDEGEWESCVSILAKVCALRREYDLQFPAQDAKLLSHIETWVTGHAAVADKVRRERELVESLLTRIEALDVRLKTPAATDAVALADVAELTAWLEEAEAAPETAHLGKAIRHGRHLKHLRQAEHLKFRARRMTRGVALGVASVVLAAFAAWFVIEAVRRRDFRDGLAAAEESRDIRPVQAFLSGPVKRFSGYAAEGDHPSRIAALRQRAEQSDAALADTLTGARALAASLDGATPDVAEAAARLAALDALAAKLPADIRSEADAALEPARRRLTELGDAARRRALDELVAARAALDVLLSKSGEPESVTAWPALSARIKSAIANPLLTECPEVVAARDTQARAMAEFGRRAALAATAAALDSADTLEAHLSALTKAPSPETPEGAAAKRILDMAKSLRALPTGLLPAATAAMAPHAKPGSRFIVGEVGALEASDAGKLASECAKMSDLWRLTLTRQAGDGSAVVTQAVFKGRPDIETFPLSGGVETRTKGERLQADGTTMRVSYTFRQFDGRDGVGDRPGVPAKAAENDLYAACSRVFDSDRGVYTESPLALVDRVYAAKNCSPLLRARLLLLLAGLMEPNAEARGLAFTPELQESLASLHGILAGAPASCSWITPERFGDILPGLTKYFAQARPAYAPLADFRAKLVRSVLDAGLVYAGRCDVNGEAALKSGRVAGERLLGVAEDGKVMVLGAVGADGAPQWSRKPAPWTPLLSLAKSPAAAAAEIASPVPAAAPSGDWTNLFLPAP